MGDMTYACGICGKKATVKKGQPAPFCCRKEMEPLPYCTKPPDAENSRLADEDGPCDDDIGNKNR